MLTKKQIIIVLAIGLVVMVWYYLACAIYAIIWLLSYIVPDGEDVRQAVKKFFEYFPSDMWPMFYRDFKKLFKKGGKK